MKQIIMLMTAMLLFCNSYAQQNELLGNAENFSVERSSLLHNTDLIQTDSDGMVLWRIGVNDTVGCDFALYSIISFTEVCNGYILSNPSDYDYWLVSRKEVIEASIYPNPATTEIYVALNSFSDDLYVTMYDVRMRHLFSIKLNNFINNIQLPTLANGTYFVEVRNTESILKTTKICLIQNSY